MLHQKDTHTFFLHKILEQHIAELLVFYFSMNLARDIDLRIIVSEHSGKPGTGGEIDDLRASWIKFKRKSEKEDKSRCGNKKFPAQNAVTMRCFHDDTPWYFIMREGGFVLRSYHEKIHIMVTKNGFSVMKRHGSIIIE